MVPVDMSRIPNSYQTYPKQSQGRCIIIIQVSVEEL